MIDTIHIVQRMAPGGIETLVLDMVRNRDDAMIFSLDGKIDELIEGWPILSPFRCRIEAFDRPPGVSPALIAKLAARLRQIRPRSIVAHHIGPLLYGGTAARLAGIRKLVHVEHDVWHYRKSRHKLIAKTLGRVLRPARVAVSSEIALEIGRLFPGEPVTVIPPGIDVGRFKPGNREAARARINLAPNAKVIGTIGRLVPVKAQDILISAIRDMRSDIHVVIVGEGPERARLEALVGREGLQHRVHFLGHRDDIDAILPAFDVFCLPSLAEGLPRSVLEAQACGVPVVTSNVGALKDAVCPVSGRLVPCGDARVLASELQHTLAHPIDTAIPRAFVVGRYALSRALEAFSTVIEEVR